MAKKTSQVIYTLIISSLTLTLPTLPTTKQPSIEEIMNCINASIFYKETLQRKIIQCDIITLQTIQKKLPKKNNHPPYIQAKNLIHKEIKQKSMPVTQAIQSLTTTLTTTPFAKLQENNEALTKHIFKEFDTRYKNILSPLSLLQECTKQANLILNKTTPPYKNLHTTQKIFNGSNKQTCCTFYALYLYTHYSTLKAANNTFNQKKEPKNLDTFLDMITPDSIHIFNQFSNNIPALKEIQSFIKDLSTYLKGLTNEQQNKIQEKINLLDSYLKPQSKPITNHKENNNTMKNISEKKEHNAKKNNNPTHTIDHYTPTILLSTIAITLLYLFASKNTPPKKKNKIPTTKTPPSLQKNIATSSLAN